MYFPMSLFAFSTLPFCHEAYESAKYTTTLSFPLMMSFFDVSRCAANSHPLSVVIVFNHSLYGKSSLHTTRRWQGLSSLFEFIHEYEVCGTFNER